jgi:hypothetical protein
MSRYLAQMGYSRQTLSQKSRRAIPLLKMRFRENLAFWMTDINQVVVQDETRSDLSLLLMHGPMLSPIRE